MDICLIDTSILVEILNIPNKSQCHAETIYELQQNITDRVSLFLPMATILECGNHIAHIREGGIRRRVADFFVSQVNMALAETSPFIAILFHQKEEVQKWLAAFPEGATREQGLGDISIIEDWNRLCRLYKRHRVYIWSKDSHLQGYDRMAYMLS